MKIGGVPGRKQDATILAERPRASSDHAGFIEAFRNLRLDLPDLL